MILKCELMLYGRPGVIKKSGEDDFLKYAKKIIDLINPAVSSALDLIYLKSIIGEGCKEIITNLINIDGVVKLKIGDQTIFLKDIEIIHI